jgi:hypothetical protein
MNGFLASLAVAASMLGQAAEKQPSSKPQWEGDYGRALQVARESGRPLLIVLDKPADPGRRVEQVRFAPDDAQQDQLRGYTLCHVDVSTPYGEKIAKAFKATEFPYTAITDRTVSVLIYENSGRFTADDWAATLASHRRGLRSGESDPPQTTTARQGRICFT